MKCPKCQTELQLKDDHGVQAHICPTCEGVWLTPAELDQLENEAFADEANKGSLYVVTHQTELKCPECNGPLGRFDYRFFDLQMDCCPEHGFWLDKGEDDAVLKIMGGEEARLERKFGAEDAWGRYVAHLRSPTFFSKVRDLFRR